MMKPFNKAWSMLKALPEQQGFMMREQLPTLYGQDMTEAPSYLTHQQRTGTIHPAILGMMERRQGRFLPPSQRTGYRRRTTTARPNTGYLPFPDRRLEVESPNFDMPEPTAKREGAIVAQGLRNKMTSSGNTSDDELTDAAQRKRGSVFDAGHYNKYGYPMVGVAQGDFSPEYRVSNYNKLPE